MRWDPGDRKTKLSQRIEGKGPDSPTPLSPRLASDAPSSTAILPLRRIGACPSTSSPRRTSSTMSSPTPSATIRSSAGAPRCLAPALRVTGSTVPGASSRATAPTPSPPHPGRRSTSATASASAPASGARRAASGRALLANGGFERSEALSAKTATLSGDRRVFCLDKVPVNWFFCR